MPELALPPAAQFTQIGSYFFCGIAVVLGAAMVVWGRILGRWLVMLAMGAGGLWLGPMAAEIVSRLCGIQVADSISQFLAVFILLVVGFFFERILWALLLSAMAVIPTAYIVLTKYWPLASKPSTVDASAPAADSLAGYLASGSLQYWQAVVAGYQEHVWPIAVSLGTAFIVPVAIGLFLPRFTRIMMTSLCGALAVVAAVMLIVGSLLPWAWEYLWKHVYIPSAIVLLLSVMGVFMQGRVSLRLDREEKQRKEAGEKEKEKDQKAAGSRQK